MKILLKTSAPWIVLSVTAALCVVFGLSFGKERSTGTTYSSFGSLVSTFAAAQASLDKHLGSNPSAAVAATTGQEPAGGLTVYDQSPSEVTKTTATAPGARMRRAGRHRSSLKGAPARPPAPAPPDSPDKRNGAPSPIEGIPVAAPAAEPAVGPIEFTPDLIRDSFDGELSKFPLDLKIANERVSLRLEGLCRWRGHFILKVAVDNQTGGDFFVKELSAYDGSVYVTIKSYFRLLVEPGRTREGHLLFDAPAGAKVKITLKEDRENGRAMELPVRYPF
ncbi:MAG: hypothetical protein HY921_12160 [Elusimicrobia bacterium]|nr:hypothetical protein [Elusimicrobiota bacterium]